ncbi:MAG TPA: signal peptidase I [Pedococcus sp.]|nr:signal peptidase I [Pedococcus sp.]
MSTVLDPPEVAAGDAPAEANPSVPSRRPWAAWLLVVGILLVGYVLIRGFLATSFVVASTSMQPAIEPGDRIIVERALDDDELRRGDIVVFDGTHGFASLGRSPHQSESIAARMWAGTVAVFGVDVGERDFVKRIVGLPGDRVVCCDDQGRVSVNGVALTESYLMPDELPSEVTFDVVVPPERVWVMGDNRSRSSDSRAHLSSPSGGMVFVDNIVGRATVRYWPLSRTGGFTPPSAFTAVNR